MNVKKGVIIEFNVEEREKINAVIPIMKEIIAEIDCSNKDCFTCPFGFFCNRQTVDQVEQEINSFINE